VIENGSRWRCEFSLRTYVFGFGIYFDNGVEVYLGVGPLVLGWSSR
jgi:hypothetical protein